MNARIAASAIPVALPASGTRLIARAAITSLWHELALYPKPGLVSLRDSGGPQSVDAYVDDGACGLGTSVAAGAAVYRSRCSVPVSTLAITEAAR